VAVDALFERVYAFYEPVDGYRVVCALAELIYLSFDVLDVFEDVFEFGSRIVLAFRPGEYIHLSCLHPDEHCNTSVDLKGFPSFNQFWVTWMLFFALLMRFLAGFIRLKWGYQSGFLRCFFVVGDVFGIITRLLCMFLYIFGWEIGCSVGVFA
jgi:hypothetical protein